MEIEECIGRGSPHEYHHLPPTLSLAKTIGEALKAWVTAEYFIGDLNELEREENANHHPRGL